jgi:tetratricopeptide (TPR) repeat protein
MNKLLTIPLIFIPLISFGQVNKLFRKANNTVDLTEKITLLSEVISLEPKNLDAYFFRAIAKHDIGDYAGAIVDYSKIIVLEPDADTYLNRGNSRYSLDDYEGAKQDYSKAFELDKNLILAKYSLGCVKYDLGDFNGAFLDFNSIIQNYLYKRNNISLPNHVYKSFLMRALVYEALGNNMKAIKDYSIIISIKPSAENYYNRGKILMEMKLYQQAHTDFDKSLSLNKNNAYAYFYRGASRLFLGKFLKAISDLSEAVKFDPMDFDAYLGLAIAYNNLNDPNNARLNFEKANAILEIGENIKTIEQYKNTFWFQNQYFHFNENVNKLVKLN